MHRFEVYTMKIRSIGDAVPPPVLCSIVPDRSHYTTEAMTSSNHGNTATSQHKPRKRNMPTYRKYSPVDIPAQNHVSKPTPQ